MNRQNFKPTCCLKHLTLPYPSTNISSKPTNPVAAQYNLQKAKSEILSAQKNAKANLEFISTELGNAQVEISTLRTGIQEMGKIVSGAKCKTLWTKKLSDLCRVKSTLQIDLTNALELESRLKRQLEEARTAYRNAKLDEQIINEDIEKLRKNTGNDHVSSKPHEETHRLYREHQCKKNVVCARDETIKSVADSITANVIQSLPGQHSPEYRRLREARIARNRMKKFITQSQLYLQEQKAVAITKEQIEQRQQAESLTKLKDDVNQIRKNLSWKNHMRKLQAEEIASEKEEVKSFLAAQGQNPYLVEYLLAIDEKQREVQRKMLLDEQKRLAEMQREYNAIEKSKEKEGLQRQKWDEIWADRAVQKAFHEKQAEFQRYFGLSEDELEEEEPTDSQLEDIRALQHGGSDWKSLSEEEMETFYDETEEITFRGRTATSSGHPRKKGSTGSPNTKSTRVPIHLDGSQKEVLLKMAGTRIKVNAVLMGANNTFDFGTVNGGQRKYINISMANIGAQPVKLKMSLLSPFGPFAFCNVLREIPSDSYYSLRFKFEPTEGSYLEKSYEEKVKIEEVGHPKNFTIVTLKGTSIGGSEEGQSVEE